MRPSFKQTVDALKKFFDAIKSVNAFTHVATVTSDRAAFADLQTIYHRHEQAAKNGQELPELAVNQLLSFEKGSPDAEAVALALEMRANYIETKDITVSANDLRERRRPVPPITEAQQLLVRRLRGIAGQLRK